MNHTILLRTRNRPEWLANCLNHYSDLDYKGKILIGDDSDQEIFQTNGATIFKFTSNLDIEHIQGAGSREQTRVRRVFLTTHQLYTMVSTKYFSVSSDDDFLFPEFIENGIKFLEESENENFSCVHGPEIKLFYNKSGCIDRKKFKEWKPSLEIDPLDRLINYAKYRSLAYEGVCRSSIIQQLYKDSDKPFGFLRSEDANLSFFDEELPWVMQIHIAGMIEYSASKIMGVRGIHFGADRIENLYLDLNNKVFFLGPIAEFASDLTPKALREAHDSIVQLLKVAKSKYSDQVLQDMVWQVFWYLFASYRTNLSHPLMHNQILSKPIYSIKERGKIELLRFLRSNPLNLILFIQRKTLMNSRQIKSYIKRDLMADSELFE